MRTIQARWYVGEADLQPIANLINICEVFDKLDESTSVTELREEFTDPALDPDRDLRLWQDDDGALIGFGQLWIPASGAEVDGFLWFKVRPDARDGAIEAEILEWGAERMREVAHERGVIVKLRSGARSDDSERLALLEEHHFSVSRYFYRMVRPLDELIPEPQFPAGLTLRHLMGVEEVPAWIEMFNQSFIDHWNHHDLTVEQRQHWLNDSMYRAERDLIAVAPDNTFAAFCFCSVNNEENARTGRNEGWINLLGTRRGFRKIGLGRAMLLAGLHRLKADGVDRAMLGVDTDSLTGATRLYESVGFKPIHTFLNYVKDI
jgi:mycothiol synthase